MLFAGVAAMGTIGEGDVAVGAGALSAVAVELLLFFYAAMCLSFEGGCKCCCIKCWCFRCCFLCVVTVSDVACAGAAAGNIAAQPLRVLLTCAVVAV